MSSAEQSLSLPRRRSRPSASLVRLLTSSPRAAVYCGCTIAALLIAYHLGKEVAWDTLDYHLYAGFSALHDRFGQDYFAAGPQGYFNPYAFVPFYLLVNSGLGALQISLILALLQSGILWLTYELAMAAAPANSSRGRVGFAICAVAFALANPILINQIGTSFSDITTAEIVILGWLLLVRAIRAPGVAPIVWAAVLLGCACALKLTNAAHTIAAGLLVLFVPVCWRKRLRWAAVFALATAMSFVVVSAPWSIRLEEHFGNPLFPLMNGVFRSPDFTTAKLVDYRFIPTSIAAALWLPFALIAPRAMVDVEWAAPDARYALLVMAAIAALLVWLFPAGRRGLEPSSTAAGGSSSRILAALGCAFAADWTIWIAVSANGRYFIPAACIAAVLAMGLIFRVCSRHPKVRNYLLLAVFGVQLYQLHVGTEYPSRLPWQNGPWFQVHVPQPEKAKPYLYFDFGVQSYSFLAPYLARGSGLINLEGGYTLPPDGMNGARVASLIRHYSPDLRIIVRNIRSDAFKARGIPNPVNANDALEPFGLKVDTRRCTRLVVNGMPAPPIIMMVGRASAKQSRQDDAGYFITCGVVKAKTGDAALRDSEQAANLAMDHLEDACPALLQPARPATYLRGDQANGYVWARQYANTDMVVWVRRGWVYFQRLIGGDQQGYAGRESVWQKASLPVECGRGAHGYYLRVLGQH